MATTCKNCCRPLIIVAGTKNCTACGAPASAWARAGAQTVMTKGGAARALSKATGQLHAVPGSRKALRNGIMTWQEAEQMALKWMKANGYRDAKLTAAGADGGVDVTAARALAQVKHHSRPVGIADVQRLYGVARAQRKKALFFSTRGFTPAAAQFARDNKVKMLSLGPVRELD